MGLYRSFAVPIGCLAVRIGRLDEHATRPSLAESAMSASRSAVWGQALSRLSTTTVSMSATTPCQRRAR